MASGWSFCWASYTRGCRMVASGGPRGHVAQSRRQSHAIDALKGQGAISKGILVRVRNGQIRHPPEILVVQIPDVLVHVDAEITQPSCIVPRRYCSRTPWPRTLRRTLSCRVIAAARPGLRRASRSELRYGIPSPLERLDLGIKRPARDLCTVHKYRNGVQGGRGARCGLTPTGNRASVKRMAREGAHAAHGGPKVA